MSRVNVAGKIACQAQICSTVSPETGASSHSARADKQTMTSLVQKDEMEILDAISNDGLGSILSANFPFRSGQLVNLKGHHLARN